MCILGRVQYDTKAPGTNPLIKGLVLAHDYVLGTTQITAIQKQILELTHDKSPVKPVLSDH